jgi:hypothetical protein
MISPPDESQSSYESELIDVNPFSFSELRLSESAVLDQAARRVLEEAGRPGRMKTSSVRAKGID